MGRPVERLASLLGVLAVVTILCPLSTGGAPHHPAAAPALSPMGVRNSRGLTAPGAGRLASTPGAGWTDTGAPTAPPGLFYPSLASDPVDGYVVLFGGCTAVICSTPSAATWEYFQGRWSELSPVKSPPARQEAVMVYDPADHYVLLYGGQGASGPLTDTWSFRGGEWTQLFPRANPGDRVDSSLTFDSADGYAVLFGGYTCNATCGTWTYHGGTWAAINTSGAPPMRYGGAMAYDVDLGKVLLFGGTSTGGAILGDTWEYVAGTWSPLGSGPAQRSDAAMAYNSVLGVILLFGGEYITLSNFPGVTYNDTWEFGATGWSQLAAPGAVPSEYEGGLALDPADGSDVLFGGCGGGGCPASQTWMFGAEASVLVVTDPGTCGSVDLAGTHAANGATLDLPVGVYALSASTCDHYALTALNGSGGVVTDYLGDAANVSSQGAVTATFSPIAYDIRVVVDPASCGHVTVGNVSVAPGGSALLAYGPYPLRAPGCSGEDFSAWSTSGHNVTITGDNAASTTVEVAGNGTLTLTYRAASSSASVPGGSILGLPTLVWLAIAVAAAIVVVAVVARPRRRPRRPTRAPVPANGGGSGSPTNPAAPPP